MAYGIFKVNKEGNTILHPDAIKLCPKLALLSEPELIYIIMVYDYVDSPYRKKPIEERRKIAYTKIALEKKLKLDFDKTKRVRDAIDEYQSLIYDKRKEMIDALLTRLYNIQDEIKSQTNDLTDSQLKSKIEICDLINKQIEKYQEQIDIDEELAELKGDKKLSFIELWKRNKMNLRKV